MYEMTSTKHFISVVTIHSDVIATKYKATKKIPFFSLIANLLKLLAVTLVFVVFTAAREDPGWNAGRMGSGGGLLQQQLGWKNCWNIAFLAFFLFYLKFCSSPETWCNSLPFTTPPPTWRKEQYNVLTFWSVHLWEFGGLFSSHIEERTNPKHVTSASMAQNSWVSQQVHSPGVRSVILKCRLMLGVPRHHPWFNDLLGGLNI